MAMICISSPLKSFLDKLSVTEKYQYMELKERTSHWVTAFSEMQCLCELPKTVSPQSPASAMQNGPRSAQLPCRAFFLSNTLFGMDLCTSSK